MSKPFFIPFACLAALLVPQTAALAQPSPKLEFEVASIKPSGLDQMKIAQQVASGQMPRLGKHINDARAEYLFMSLADLIVEAYKIKAHQLTGPDWLKGGMTAQRFDVVAKMPAGATKDDSRVMLQKLLADRFKLQVHRETREQPVLALVVAKGGAKLKETAEEGNPIDPDAPLKPGEMKMDTGEGEARMKVGKDGTASIDMGKKGRMDYSFDRTNMSLHLAASQMTMEGFVDMLTQFSKMGGGEGRTVVDKTGLKGNYQIALDIPMADLMNMARAAGANVPDSAPGATAPADAASDPGSAGVLQSVHNLGLKLENQKASVDVLIVDHAEKMPTEN